MLVGKPEFKETKRVASGSSGILNIELIKETVKIKLLRDLG
jgi:hypothetical protein